VGVEEDDDDDDDDDDEEDIANSGEEGEQEGEQMETE
jgi:hypothetical protein